jgi:dihydrofolate reductase
MLRAILEEPSEGRAMRELLVTTFLTLDGVMQGPGGPKEDDSGGFSHGGWSVNYWDDLMAEVMNEATSKPFAMVLGRRTFDIMAAYWPTASRSSSRMTDPSCKCTAART